MNLLEKNHVYYIEIVNKLSEVIKTIEKKKKI